MPPMPRGSPTARRPDGASIAFAAAVAEDPDHARAHAALAMIATERPDRAGGRDAVNGHLARPAPP